MESGASLIKSYGCKALKIACRTVPEDNIKYCFEFSENISLGISFESPAENRQFKCNVKSYFL